MPKTILLFHGLTGSEADMKPLSEYLESLGYAVLVPRFLGHGGSLADLKDVQVRDWLLQAEEVAEQMFERESGPFYLGGLSFGSLIALYLAAKYRDKIEAVVAISPPIKLGNPFVEQALSLFSLLPEPLFGIFGSIKKTDKPADYLNFPYQSYSSHLISSVLRMFKIRRKALSSSANISSPILIMQDPFDHHLAPESGILLAQSLVNATLELDYIPQGRHELVLGPEYEKVWCSIGDFLEKQTVKS